MIRVIAMTKEFEMTHLFWKGLETDVFTEDTAPKWLRFGGIKGSTMCNRWFWGGHIMKLEVGESIKTDYNEIRRIA